MEKALPRCHFANKRHRSFDFSKPRRNHCVCYEFSECPPTCPHSHSLLAVQLTRFFCRLKCIRKHKKRFCLHRFGGNFIPDLILFYILNFSLIRSSVRVYAFGLKNRLIVLSTKCVFGTNFCMCTVLRMPVCGIFFITSLNIPPSHCFHNSKFGSLQKNDFVFQNQM